MAQERQRIEGVWATVLLDVDDDGAVRLEAIEGQVAALAGAGVDGIYCHGTAGEFHCLSDAQWRVVSRKSAEACKRKGLPFQIGACHPLALAALERVRLAAQMAPRAIQVILPDWTPLDRGGTIRFLAACGMAAGGFDLVVYNPPQAKTVLEPDDYAAIVDADVGVAGIKCGGGDADWYAAMAPVLARLSVFVPGHHYASGRLAGAHGAYSNMACLNPAGAVRWARQVNSAPETALGLERRIATFMNEAITPMIGRGLPGHACDKAMAAAGGWARIEPRMLWPHEGAYAEEVATIRRAAAARIPEFLAP